MEKTLLINVNLLYCPGQKNLVEYEIQRTLFEISSEKNFSLARVTFIIRRRMEYHVFSTFLQTGILVLIGYVTFYFNIDDFTNRIMVNLTAALVIATLVSSVREVF